MVIRRVTTESELEEAFIVRKEVFVEEQGVAAEVELDEHDSSARHIVLYHDNQPIGTGRLRVVDGLAKLERICVLAVHRKHGYGREIMKDLELMGKELGLSQAKLNAQTHAADFYVKLGYHITSDVFMEEGMPHVTMVKELGPEI